MSERTPLGYAHAFFSVADQHASAAQDHDVDGMVGGMMAIIAMHNAVVGARKVLGANHAQVLACLAETPELKIVRDMMTYFDEYVAGEGKLQRASNGADGPFGWMPFWNSPTTLLIVVRQRTTRWR